MRDDRREPERVEHDGLVHLPVGVVAADVASGIRRSTAAGARGRQPSTAPVACVKQTIALESGMLQIPAQQV